MPYRFPQLKKTIGSYISEENGRITKQSLLSLGAILASAAIIASRAKDANAATLHQHSHLAAHSSTPTAHASHASY